MAEEQLLEYYNYLYPFDTLTRWLTYEGSSKLCHRELSFEMNGRDSTYVERYVTFADGERMKERMVDRRANVPLKVDAGAIWNNIPRKNGPSETVTVERELIFDFDMNDYDDVRTCCEGKKVCVKCWRLLIIAVEIMESALREDFGFEKFMYVFSGGRGLHIWVCDKRARQMKDVVRKGLVDYLELVHGNAKAESLLADNVVKQTDDIKNLKYRIRREKETHVARDDLTDAYLTYSCSSHTDRSLAILRRHFLAVMEEQQAFMVQKSLQVMYRVFSQRHEKLKENISYQWEQARKRGEARADKMHEIMMKEVVRYETSRTTAEYASGKQPDDRVHRLSMVEEEIMLSFLYPRVDHHVSTMQNHLLKLPFSVHPSSRKISIPLFKRQIHDFDPAKCVAIGPLLESLEELRKQNRLTGRNEANAQMTLLRQSVEAMEEFIVSLRD